MCVCVCALVIVTAVHSAKCLLYTVDMKQRPGDIVYTKMQCSAANTAFAHDHYVLLW